MPRTIRRTVLRTSREPHALAGILETLSATGRFRTFIAAVAAARLGHLFRGSEPITVFAPSDHGFERMSAERAKAMLTDQEHLAAVLRGHIVTGWHMERELGLGAQLTTLDDTTIAVSLGDGELLVGGRGVVTTDIVAGNGVVHELDQVL
jgi:uncharacterized surface protein with fasciclin (FAS1) repeats